MAVFFTLGSVTFANYEIPNSTNFGGAQALSVLQLVGGRRIIDVMGRIDDDISWSGRFRGTTAVFRAKFLDTMRVQGMQIPLTWDQFNFMVVIEHFSASFERFYEIPYSINCKVVQDLNKPFPVLVPVAYNDAILNLLTEANDLAVEIANPSITSAMAILSDTINNVGSFTNATNAEIATVSIAVASTEEVVSSAISSLSAEIF